MMGLKTASLILITAVIAAPVRADVTVDGKPVQNTAGGQILIRESDCRELMRHVPRDDVAFRPGQDVHGDPVPPADLEPSLDLGGRANNFAFAVSVDLDDRLSKGGEGQVRPFGAEGYIGYVEIRDGRAYWQGQPLDRDGIAAVSEACKKAGLEKDKKDR